MIVGSGLNITNAYAVAFFLNLGAEAVVLSDEILDEDVIELKKLLKTWGYQGNVGRLAYGRRDLMITKYCLINTVMKDGSKKGCSECKKTNYSLMDMQKNKYPIIGDDLCVSHILEEVPHRKKIGEDEFKVIRFTIESPEEIINVLTERKEK